MNKRERRAAVMAIRNARNPNPLRKDPFRDWTPPTVEEWQAMWDELKVKCPERLTEEVRAIAIKKGVRV